MKSPADSHEMTILESKGILIHDQIFHAVLTDRRIILTRYSENKLIIRSIYFTDIQEIEEDMNYSGNPVIILEISSAKGKIKKVVLHFSQKNLPDSIKERSLWASEINKILRSVFRVSPAQVLKKPPVTKVFCITCGTKFTDGSAFWYQVWEENNLPGSTASITSDRHLGYKEGENYRNSHRKYRHATRGTFHSKY